MGLRNGLTSSAWLGWPSKRSLRHLRLLRPRRRMKTDRDIHLLRFLPERIEIAIVNLPAIDRLRTKRQPDGAILHRALGFLNREIDVVQRDQRRAFQSLRIRLAEVRHPIVPRLAQIVGIFRLEVLVGMQRRSAKQHGDVEPFLVHCRQLRHVVIVARQRLVEALRHLVLMKIDHVTGRPDRLAVAQKITGHAMLGARLTDRNPFAPFGIHVLRVQVRRLEHMHIAVECAETILGHGLSS